MEYFGARDDRPIETCLAEVRRSDILVVVVAHRYGTLVTGQGISYSEAEYQEAHELGKPCFVYFLADDVPVLPSRVERDPDKMRKLEQWKQQLTDRHTIATFRSGQELAVQVAADLGRALRAEEAAAVDKRPVSLIAVRELDVAVAELMRRALDAGFTKAAVVGVVRLALEELISPSTHWLYLRIVIVYASPDSTFANAVASELDSLGADILLEPSSEFTSQAIGQLTFTIESAEFVLLFLSTAATSAPWMRGELDAAIWRQISLPGSAPILPVLLEDTDVPTLLRTGPLVDVRGKPKDIAVGDVIAAIRRYRHERRVLNRDRVPRLRE
jgi:Domain of unknown function (DUF4062)/TIR domain